MVGNWLALSPERCGSREAACGRTGARGLAPPRLAEGPQESPGLAFGQQRTRGGRGRGPTKAARTESLGLWRLVLPEQGLESQMCSGQKEAGGEAG